MPLIKTKNLYKVYNPGEDNEVRALRDINLEIEKGELVAILGQSGSGKSTLMNILGCLDVPTLGEYYLAGELVSSMSDGKLSHIRNKEIGFIFQGFNLIPSLTAVENVELPLIYRGIRGRERRRLAEEALEKVGLGERKKHRPPEMSGGQQQRLAIARAISVSPPIIMADEPTGNLDSKSGSEIIEILWELNRAGHTIILITHDRGIAQKAKRIVQIQDGRIIDDRLNNES